MSTEMEMPKYKSHKEVWALKIGRITFSFSDKEQKTHYTIKPEDDKFKPIVVTREYIEKHKPKVGGYYVVYEDGYQSFSPAEAFESGYSLI